MASTSSSSSSSPSIQQRHQVFVCFRGEDTRINFIGHLVGALRRKKIAVFIDNTLEKGEEISPALLKAIDDAQISIVVLSENFASSGWCRIELSKIIFQKRNMNQTVVPIFYHVDPSEIRKSAKELEMSDLNEVANLAGWHIPTHSKSNSESDYDMIEQIVADISRKLTGKSLTAFKGERQVFLPSLRVAALLPELFRICLILLRYIPILRGPSDNTIQVDAVKPDEPIAAIEEPVLTLENLKEMTHNFGSNALIGESNYGGTYYADLYKGKRVAMKKLNVSPKPAASMSTDAFLSKASVVSRLKHENLVELQAYFIEGSLRVLVYEFANMGSLHDILHSRHGPQGAQPGPTLNWRQRVKIAVDAAIGLAYLHNKVQPAIIHGDIRSSNVLLFEDFKAKLGDYNLTNKGPKTAILDFHFSLHRSHKLPAYHAPELQTTEKWTQQSDVYSFGVVLLELLTGRKPINISMPLKQRSLVTWAKPRLRKGKVEQCVDPRLDGQYPPQGPAKLATIALSCVKDKPKSRPDISTVVNDLQQLLELLPPQT